MKIAVCFSSQIRTGLITAQNIKKYIGELYPLCDFFVHTWDTTTVSMNDVNYKIQDHDNFEKYKNKPTKVDPNIFEKFYATYHPISMVVEPYLLNEVQEVPGGRRYNHNLKKNTLSLFESIYECNQLKLNHENKFNYKYDYVLRLRPDLVIHPNKSLSEDLKELNENNDLLFAGHKKSDYNNRTEDIFWISNSETMDKISMFYSYETNNITDDWQPTLYNWLVYEQNIRPKKLLDSTMCPYYISDFKINADPMGTEIYERQY